MRNFCDIFLRGQMRKKYFLVRNLSDPWIIDESIKSCKFRRFIIFWRGLIGKWKSVEILLCSNFSIDIFESFPCSPELSLKLFPIMQIVPCSLFPDNNFNDLASNQSHESHESNDDVQLIEFPRCAHRSTKNSESKSDRLIALIVLIDGHFGELGSSPTTIWGTNCWKFAGNSQVLSNIRPNWGNYFRKTAHFRGKHNNYLLINA